MNELTNAKISQLRELLINATDLEEISDFFHTALVPDDDFMSAGQRSSEPRLLAALHAVLERVAPGGKLTPLFARLDQQRLCHGYSTWGPGHAVFFYFEQLDLGFCSYSPSLTSVEVSFLRFRLADVTGAVAWTLWPNGAAARSVS